MEHFAGAEAAGVGGAEVAANTMAITLGRRTEMGLVVVAAAPNIKLMCALRSINRT
jgi:hypothetical protein